MSLDRKYSPLTCDVLSELRQCGEYCDVVLRTDDQQLFQVHRPILCCKRKSNSFDDYLVFFFIIIKHVVHSFEHCLPME